jgi:hypothetical protein
VRACGDKLAADLEFEELATLEGRFSWAWQVANALGGLTAEHVSRAVAEADALKPLACASRLAVNPLTHFHRGHIAPKPQAPKPQAAPKPAATKSDTMQARGEETRGERQARGGFDGIERDAQLRQWLLQKGYAIESK